MTATDTLPDTAAAPAGTADPRLCQQCQQRPVQVCDECRRACAFKDFTAISRHPEAGTGCLVCEDGPPSWCGCCWAEAVAATRATLRDQSGYVIGRWPDYGH